MAKLMLTYKHLYNFFLISTNPFGTRETKQFYMFFILELLLSKLTSVYIHSGCTALTVFFNVACTVSDWFKEELHLDYICIYIYKIMSNPR